MLCLHINDLQVHSSFQRDDGEKSVVYNTMGPNVCMGDHKVTDYISSVLCTSAMWTDSDVFCFSSVACVLVLLTEDK